MALSTDFKDDILNESVNEKRKYQMTYNGDGTVSFTDVTSYSQTGSEYGAAEVNEERQAINALNSALATRNVYAENRYNQDANAFYGQAGGVAFFHVNIETATGNNHFPTEGYPGTLMAINIYGAHLIQVFFCMDGYIYMRTLSDYQNPSGASFTQWRKI